jgi:hypothetical protein
LYSVLFLTDRGDIMKISDFEYLGTTGELLEKVEHAEVTVTTGTLWWKKSERKKIQRKALNFWFFVDTGDFTPGLQVEELERVYKAKQALAELS